ncbi:MAG TPA: hypothetical protein VKV25_09170 [Acidimicrobiales bacterium]|nr:hypothetical protein [Acidimicrobiales bacterium]
MSDAPAAPVARPRPKRGYLLPGTIALTVLAAGAALFAVVGLQTHYPGHLAGPEVASQIGVDIQTRSARAEALPPTVRCPAREPVRAGYVFHCTLVRGGRATRTITVTEGGGGSYRYALAGR